MIAYTSYIGVYYFTISIMQYNLKNYKLNFVTKVTNIWEVNKKLSEVNKNKKKTMKIKQYKLNSLHLHFQIFFYINWD